MSIVLRMDKGLACSGKTTFIQEMVAAMPDRKFLLVSERDSKAAVKLWMDSNPYGVVIYGER